MLIEDHPNKRVRSARKKRALLMARLGGKCVDCGTTNRLEFDHIHGKDYDPRKMNRWTRMKRIEDEADQGLIELRCRSCNAKRGDPRAKGEDW